MTALEELGEFAKVPLEILELEPGSLIRLDQSAGENIQIHIGAVRMAARDIVALENIVCIRVTDLMDRE